MALITAPDFEDAHVRPGENTTIGVIATNADLTKSPGEQAGLRRT